MGEKADKKKDTTKGDKKPDQELIEQCFRVPTSWGDDSLPWFVYRRVRNVMAGVAECHRFEIRSPQTVIGGGNMYVFYSCDVIGIKALLKQERVHPADWGAEWVRFMNTLMEPWNVV